MVSTRRFVVELLGLDERELRLLSRIGSLTAGRPRSYVFLEEPRERPDIVVVDGDNPGALDTWQWAYAAKSFPTIFLSAKGEAPSGYRALKLPLVPTRLLTLLDEVTVNDLRYVPELKIGDAPDFGLRVPQFDTQQQASGPKILVVDDSSTVRKQMELCLGMLGLAVTLCETGEAALQSLATTSYRLAFLDVVLPGVDGYHVCKSIKKNKETKATPVVMLTSKSSPFDRIKGSLAGCDTYLTKPVENETLTQVLEQYLGSKENWGLPSARR